jgi:uncharacterized protein involved in exopolysaccharide biosynthesis
MAEEIYLLELLLDAWQRKWRIIGVSLAVAVVVAGLSLLLPNWYTAEVTLAPGEERTAASLAGPFSSLANLAGITVGGGDTTEAVAVLKSRDLARTFIERELLLTVLFADRWDAAKKRWKDTDIEKQPDIRDAVRYWDRKLRGVSEDRRTRIVTLTVEWKDAALAAKWANDFAEMLNERMRQRALDDAQTSIDYLRNELAKTDEVVLQQSISRLIETEMQKLMMARGNPEFAFKIIDHAEVPKRKSSPQRALMVIGAAFLTGCGMVGYFVWSGLRRRRAAAAGDKLNEVPEV